MSEKFWYLKSCALFEQLAPEDAALLESRARARTFERKQLVYVPDNQADSLLVVTSGRIKLYHITPEGRESILALIEPGEVFGELCLLDTAPRDEFAEAMAKTQIILIPGDVVRQLMEQRPRLALSVTKLIGLRRRRLERRMKALLFRSMRERLVHVLLDLASQYGQPMSDGLRINIRLSHQELANMIGSTRESVTVLLGELQSEQALLVQRRMITLIAPDRLAASVGEPAPRVQASPMALQPHMDT